MHAQYVRSALEENSDERPTPRLALGGGSDGPPPDQEGTSATVVPFPIERLHRPAEQPVEGGGDGSAWAAWMNSTLSVDPIAGLRAEG